MGTGRSKAWEKSGTLGEGEEDMQLYVSLNMELKGVRDRDRDIDESFLIPHVYGSLPLVGSWDPSKALTMERESTFRWEISFVVPPNHETLDFKFLLKPKHSSSFCVIEEGINRLLTGGALHGDAELAFFRLPENNVVLEYHVYIKADKVSPFDLAASWRAYQKILKPSTVRRIPDVSIDAIPVTGLEDTDVPLSHSHNVHLSEVAEYKSVGTDSSAFRHNSQQTLLADRDVGNSPKTVQSNAMPEAAGAVAAAAVADRMLGPKEHQQMAIVLVAETRFASNTIVLRHLIKVKDALTRMVTSANWTVWRQSNSDRATTIRGLILNESWWDRAEYLLKITEPILTMIRYTDMDRPCLGEVYDGIDSMIEGIRNIVNEKEQDPDEKFFKELQLIMIERWNKMTTPLHLLAFALSPRFYSQSVLKGSTTRVPPYRDPEVAQGYKAALRRLFFEHLRPAVRAKFMSFASTDDCGIEALEDKNNANAHKWWFYHGEKYQHLQPIAIKILSQVGLPARGKTFTAAKLTRYLRWLGHETKHFNVGKYRRLKVGINQTADFFRADNQEGVDARNEVAALAMEDMLSWMMEGGQVGIFDATNSTRKRRNMLMQMAEGKCKIIFLETICNDQAIIEQNIRLKTCQSPDYANQPDLEAAMQDFKSRLSHYEKVYEPVEEGSYIKMIDTVSGNGGQMQINNISGYLPGRIVFFLVNTHLTPRPILLTRHGESRDNVRGRIGGDSILSEAGEEYALKLADFVNQRLRNERTACLWTSTLQRTILTAQHISEFPKIQWRALDEINAGVCDGMTYEEIKKNTPEEYDARKADKLRYRYPRGESYLDVIQRLEPVIIELERQRAPVVVIAHQAVLRALYAYFADKPLKEVPHIEVPLHSMIEIQMEVTGVHEKIYKLMN